MGISAIQTAEDGFTLPTESEFLSYLTPTEA